MSYTGGDWLHYVNGANLYWSAIRLEMAQTAPDPAKTIQSGLLHDGPGKGYGTVWRQLHTSMAKTMGPTHPIVKRMEEVQPDGDRKKLHECLVFWATVAGAHTETLRPADSSWDITIDKTAAQSPDLGKAQRHMQGEIKTFNTYISMEVARCMQLKWSIVILGGEGGSATTSWVDHVPAYVGEAYKVKDFDTDTVDVSLWYHVSNDPRTPPALKIPLKSADDLDDNYLWAKQSHTATPYHPKKKKPAQPIHTPTASDSSSSGGMWILLLLLLVAGMYLYSK